jgi:hypothetical protein
MDSKHIPRAEAYISKQKRREKNDLPRNGKAQPHEAAKRSVVITAWIFPLNGK